MKGTVLEGMRYMLWLYGTVKEMQQCQPTLWLCIKEFGNKLYVLYVRK